MASVLRLPTRVEQAPPHDESILGALLKLLKLELGIAETRELLVSAAIEMAIAAPALVVAAPRDRGRRLHRARARRARVERMAARTPFVAEGNRGVFPGELAMARSTAEIQADIAVTRRMVEHQLEGLSRRVPNRWWMPYAILGGAHVAGAEARA
jgi:hypothetical protein